MADGVPPSVLGAFPIGAVRAITPIRHGLIHGTWRVDAERGAFILQRLHPVLASEEVAEDFRNVTAFLNDRGFPAPRCVLSTSGRVLVHDEHQVPWRLQTFLPGNTFHRVSEPGLAREAGRLYARFHRVMSEFPYPFRSTRVLHDTRRVLSALASTATQHEAAATSSEVRDDVAFLLAELPGLLLPEDLPPRVIHGDPKVSNILFDDTGRASALVDLDTCNRRPLALELGDAFRSWCGREEDQSHNSFRIDVFEAGWTAYVTEAGSALTTRERASAAQGIGLITLELAARFLTDYFADEYFGWDASRYPSRRAHNLARACGQIALYRDFVRQTDAVAEIIAAPRP